MIEQGIQYICDTAKTPAQIVNSCFGFVHDTVSELENRTRISQITLTSLLLDHLDLSYFVRRPSLMDSPLTASMRHIQIVCESLTYFKLLPFGVSDPFFDLGMLPLLSVVAISEPPCKPLAEF